MKPAVKIAITGAAGNIAYSLIFHIASGNMLGKDQPIILHLVEIPGALDSLKGVVMELEDCAFPLLQKVVATSDVHIGFEDIDYAMLVGAKPRSKGMERKDLLLGNAQIFSAQGKALDAVAKSMVKVLVVGNPANTNALITQHNAPNIAANQFTAMTRLDHQRTLAQLSAKLKIDHTQITQVAIWGNHSSSQYPDIFHALADGQSVINRIEHQWVENDLIPSVQDRGAAVINARGSSSAASAAIAATLHIRDWSLGAKHGDWVSMSVKGQGAYDIDDDLIFSYPLLCQNGEYQIVQDLQINDFSMQRIRLSEKELIEERDAVRHLL